MRRERVAPEVLAALPADVRPSPLTSWHRPVSVGRDGVAIWICGARLKYGADDQAIKALPIGTRVRVSFNPNDIGSIGVWGMRYTFISQAQANETVIRRH